MSAEISRDKGFLLTEMTVSLTLLATLIAALGLSLHGFAKFNRYQLVRQQCIAAAQAQLDSIAATGGPIPGEDLGRLWPNISVSVERSSGSGQWSGMQLIETVAVGRSFRKEVKIRLSRYLPADSGAEGK